MSLVDGALVSTNPFALWPEQLAVAIPFVLALAFLGKYLMGKLDQADREKKELYDKIISDLLSAILVTSTGMEKNTDALNDLLNFVSSLKVELQGERELRARLEERLKLAGQIDSMYPSIRRGSNEVGS